MTIETNNLVKEYEMNMPKFTAEASLYLTSGRYYLSSHSHKGEINANLVQPSAAIYVGGRYVCDGEVTAGGFIDCYSSGGGAVEPPELRCGPCIRGRQRCGIPGLGFKWGPCIDDWSRV